MLAFSRITSVLFFVLSLSLFAYAAPTPAYDSDAVAPGHSGNEVLTLVAELELKAQTHVDALAQLGAIADVEARVGLMLVDIGACAKAVLALGTNLDVDTPVKAKIAVKVAAIITVIVKACIALVAKFGILALLTIFAKIDFCLHLLLTNLGVCVEGIVKLVAEIVVKLGVSVFAQVHLGLCINVMGLIGLQL